MNHQRRGRGRRLSIQSLESRRLLAAASISSQLYESAESGPGAPISGPIDAGESFYLRVSAIEHDPFLEGFRGVSLNVQWDPASVALIEQDFDLDKILNPDLPAYREGTFDQQVGRIYNLRAVQMEELGAGRAIGDGEAASIATLHFIALTPDSSTAFKVSEGASGIYPAPYRKWQRGDIEFQSASLSVVAANPQPQESSSQDAPEASTEAPTESKLDDSNIKVDVSTVQSISEHEDIAEPKLANAEPEPAAATVPDATVPDATVPDATVPDATVVDAVSTNVPKVGADDIEEAQHSQPTSASQIDVELIDEALSFDMNEDGIFDLADFGLLNVAAADTVIEVAPEPELEPSVQEIAASTANDHTLNFNILCTAKPPQDDVAAVELWMDALATAWLADADARESRREERIAAELLDAQGVVI